MADRFLTPAKWSFLPNSASTAGFL